MPNVARFGQFPGVYPAVGYLQRVMLIVTAVPDVATRARLIVVAKEYADTAAGGTTMKAERYAHVFDSDADGTPTLVVTAAGVALDRIFNGDGVPYENLDDERKPAGSGGSNPNPSGVNVGTGRKMEKLYWYIELNGTPTGSYTLKPVIMCKAAAMDLANLRYIAPGSTT